MLRELATDLALDRPPVVLRDPAWWILITIGLAACLALWTILGIDPTASVPRGAGSWIGVIGLQPLVEELLFRGVVQGALLRTIAGARRCAQLSVANGVSSLAFVALHFVHHPPLWALATLAPSLALGWLRERHGSTWSAALTHAIFNAEFFASAAACSA